MKCISTLTTGRPSSPSGSGLKGLLRRVTDPIIRRFGDKPGEDPNGEVSPLGTPNDRNFAVEIPDDFERKGPLNGESLEDS